jgi:hypothetical protein
MSMACDVFRLPAARVGRRDRRRRAGRTVRRAIDTCDARRDRRRLRTVLSRPPAVCRARRDRRLSRSGCDRGGRGGLGDRRAMDRCVWLCPSFGRSRLGRRSRSLGRRRLGSRRLRRGDRCGGRRLGGRRRGRPRRQEGQRIDVSLILARRAQPEVDVRLREVDDAARADRADRGAFGQVGAARDADRAKVDERRRKAERCLDRHRLAAGRNRAGERHRTVRRGEHGRAGRRTEIDAAMLARRVRMSCVEGEGAEHRPVDRPRPGPRRPGWERERRERNDCDSTEHEASLLPKLRTERP